MKLKTWKNDGWNGFKNSRIRSETCYKGSLKKTVKKIKQDNNLTFDLFDVEHDEEVEKRMVLYKANEAKEEANKEAEAKKLRQQAIT